MTHPYFFGYGSLVNRGTHDYARAHQARITGWRRAWRHVEGRQVAFLTAVPSPGAVLQGLVAEVPDGDWAALDLRERHYLRISAEGVEHPLKHEADIQIYHAPKDLHALARVPHPVLLSYIDVVVQGYLAEFGETGVRNFFATTDGWDAPILNDRADPIYPRHQVLTTEETALVDHHLETLHVRFVTAGDAGF